MMKIRTYILIMLFIVPGYLSLLYCEDQVIDSGRTRITFTNLDYYSDSAINMIQLIEDWSPDPIISERFREYLLSNNIDVRNNDAIRYRESITCPYFVRYGMYARKIRQEGKTLEIFLAENEEYQERYSQLKNRMEKEEYRKIVENTRVYEPEILTLQEGYEECVRLLEHIFGPSNWELFNISRSSGFRRREQDRNFIITNTGKDFELIYRFENIEKNIVLKEIDVYLSVVDGIVTRIVLSDYEEDFKSLLKQHEIETIDREHVYEKFIEEFRKEGFMYMFGFWNILMKERAVQPAEVKEIYGDPVELLPKYFKDNVKIQLQWIPRTAAGLYPKTMEKEDEKRIYYRIVLETKETDPDVFEALQHIFYLNAFTYRLEFYRRYGYQKIELEGERVPGPPPRREYHEIQTVRRKAQETKRAMLQEKEQSRQGEEKE